PLPGSLPVCRGAHSTANSHPVNRQRPFFYPFPQNNRPPTSTAQNPTANTILSSPQLEKMVGLLANPRRAELHQRARFCAWQQARTLKPWRQWIHSSPEPILVRRAPDTTGHGVGDIATRCRLGQLRYTAVFDQFRWLVLLLGFVALLVVLHSSIPDW